MTTTVPSHPLHLYRALLRECTYLPDTNSRRFFNRYIISSFRSYIPRIRAWRENIPIQRQVRLHSRARKQLSMLQRANEGYLKPLEKVLMMTYGRKGKRRRELMVNLMSPIPENDKEVEGFSLTPKMYTREWKPPLVLGTLMRSQAARAGQFDRSSARLRRKPNIPEKSIWGKNLSAARVNNAMRKWYARVTEVVLPPLPEYEWQHLQALANGTAPWDGPVRRRSKTESAGDSGIKPSSFLEGPEIGNTFRKYADGRPHRITRRLMQRLWAVVLRHAPTLLTDWSNDKVVVHWDDAIRPRQTVALPNQEQASVMFGG